MPPAGSTSARLRADLYALTHCGNAGDAAFYARVCEGASSVLELGAGYGRLLPRLARARRSIVGLELDPELLRAAARVVRTLPTRVRTSVRLVRGDMRKFAFEERFEHVILPYNGLFCLLTKSDALACFRSVRAALAPGGTFAFDVWNAEPFHSDVAAARGADDPELVVTLRHAGRTYDVFEQSRIRRAAQRIAVTYTYVPRPSGIAPQISIDQRYYRAAELMSLLGRAGLVVQKRYGDFSGARFTPRTPQLIVIARAV
jgi:SAM-dependent methyltransferase